MVLPPPAPDPEPGSAGWLARLKRLIGLGRRGVMVLATGAGPEHYGPVARALRSLGEPVHVVMGPGELSRAPRGALVLVHLIEDHLAAFNFERPHFAEAGLRAVLLADAETATALGRDAPDLLDWISHVVECPRILPGFLHRSLATLTAAPGISVPEVDIETLWSTLSGKVKEAPSPWEYPELVAFLRRTRGVAVVHVAGEAEALRLRCAIAEAGRRGRVIAAGWPVIGWPRVDERPEAVDEAVERLRAAGVSEAGELAVALDLEPAALELAVQLVRRGVLEDRLLEAAWGAEDGGAALGALTVSERLEGVADWTAPTPVLRAGVADPRSRKSRAALVSEVQARLPADEDDLSPAHKALWAQSDKARPTEMLPCRRMARWDSLLIEPHLRAGGAWEARDAAEILSRAAGLWWRDVVLWWTREERLSDWPWEASFEALESRGLALLNEGEVTEATSVADRLDAESRGQVMNSLRTWRLTYLHAAVLSKQKRFAEATAMLQGGLASARKSLGPDHEQHVWGLSALARAREGAGDRDGAEAASREALAAAERLWGGLHPEVGLALAYQSSLLLKRGALDEAEENGRRGLAIVAEALGVEHPAHAASLLMLTSVLLAAGSYEEAQNLAVQSLDLAARWEGDKQLKELALFLLSSLLRLTGALPGAEAIARLAIEQVGESSERVGLGLLMSSLGSVLAKQGRYADAEAPLMRAAALLEGQPEVDGATLAPILVDLSLVLLALGRAQEGRNYLERALEHVGYGTPSPSIDVGHVVLARAFFEQAEDDPTASATAREAVDLLTSMLGAEHPATLNAINASRSLRESVGLDVQLESQREPE